MSVKDRIKKRIDEQLPNAKRTKNNNDLAMPVSIMKDFLLEHGLLKIARVENKVDEVASLIRKLFQMGKQSNKKNKEKSNCCDDTTDEYNIDNIWKVFDEQKTEPIDASMCSHKFLLQTRDGDNVCSECGCCVSRVYEDTPWSNIIAADQMTGKNCKFSKNIIKLANHPTSEETRQYNIAQSVEHWGPYARVSEGAIEDAKINATKIASISSSFNIAAISALMYPLVECIPSESEIEYAMRNRKPLPKVENRAPKPIFPCNACGKLQFTAKSARWHCKLNNNYGIV